MPIEITMPSLAAGMTEGNLSRWLKAENEPVQKGVPEQWHLYEVAAE